MKYTSWLIMQSVPSKALSAWISSSTLAPVTCSDSTEDDSLLLLR